MVIICNTQYIDKVLKERGWRKKWIEEKKKKRKKWPKCHSGFRKKQSEPISYVLPEN